MDTSLVIALARAMAALLGQGLAQDDATAHCLAESLGPLPPDVLAARLGDPDDLEAAPLRALLLFPGPQTALALEPALAAADLDPAGQTALVAALAASVGEVRVFGPGLPPLCLKVGPADLAAWVGRLRPAATAPEPVRAVLAERFAPGTALALAVACRQAGLAWTAPRRAFAVALFSRLDPDAPDTPGVVRFALGFLADLAPDSPPLDGLTRLRDRLAGQLRRARDQAAALAGSNFETLVATGHRLPYLHAPDIARDLALADRALLALTGRTGASAEPTRRELGTVADARELFETLSRFPFKTEET